MWLRFSSSQSNSSLTPKVYTSTVCIAGGFNEEVWSEDPYLNFMSKNSTINRPNFKSEAEEADWYHTPEGHAYSLQSLKKAAREGRLRFRNGTTGKPPTAAEVKQLLEQARAQLLKPVSI